MQALPRVAERCVPGARWMLVADETTWAAAGAAAQAALQAQGAVTAAPLVLPAQPRLKPRAETAQRIAQQLREHGATPVAVGSGVINDLVKYAAAQAGTPYLCLATAASMDGYAASGAALLEDGFKRTLACAPPLAVLADPQVLASAPPRMAGWGYGDLAGKAVAGADWMLADALCVEAINPEPFNLVQDNLAGWLAAPQRLAERDPAALAGLLSGLLVSGFAMQAHGNSRPASGSDHQFSHLWEMEGLQAGGEPAAHGACVGVGCVAMLALYEWLLDQPDAAFAGLAAMPEPGAVAIAAEVRAALGSGEVAVAALKEMTEKHRGALRAVRVQRFAKVWPELRHQLASRLMGAADMQAGLRAAGAAAHPADLGLELATLATDYRRARLIRRRYTLLDLLDDLGWLDRAIAALFTPSGFWGRQARASPVAAASLAN
ncbi:MAG: iron-containing alcohol dehydrogenase [Burkholderiales bacterium]|nr:iron-containing alcohol dehydrogenase [Burkholderiales bacterium]